MLDKRERDEAISVFLKLGFYSAPLWSVESITRHIKHFKKNHPGFELPPTLEEVRKRLNSSQGNLYPQSFSESR